MTILAGTLAVPFLYNLLHDCKTTVIININMVILSPRCTLLKFQESLALPGD